MIGGNASRWNHFLGVTRKCDITINDVSLLENTRRLLEKYEHYPVVYDTPHRWGPLACLTEESFIYRIVMGDTYFTEETIRQICTYLSPRIGFFGSRSGPFKGYPEIYGVVIPLKRVSIACSILDRCWGEVKLHTLYRALSDEQREWIEVDGRTEDFDYPHDLDNWIKHWR